MKLELNDKEKAAFVIGMVKAFDTTKWPKHFSKDDKAGWNLRAKWAKQMLSGGAFNPMDVWEVRELANEELGEPYATD